MSKVEASPHMAEKGSRARGSAAAGYFQNVASSAQWVRRASGQSTALCQEGGVVRCCGVCGSWAQGAICNLAIQVTFVHLWAGRLHRWHCRSQLHHSLRPTVSGPQTQLLQHWSEGKSPDHCQQQYAQLKCPHEALPTAGTAAVHGETIRKARDGLHQKRTTACRYSQVTDVGLAVGSSWEAPH